MHVYTYHNIVSIWAFHFRLWDIYFWYKNFIWHFFFYFWALWTCNSRGETLMIRSSGMGYATFRALKQFSTCSLFYIADDYYYSLQINTEILLFFSWNPIGTISKYKMLKKELGGTRSWTMDLSICSRMLYHWAIPPNIFWASQVWDK